MEFSSIFLSLNKSIIEAKVNESSKKAIEQINKLYVPQLQDGKEIIKVLINWDRKKEKFDIEIVRH